MVRPYLTVASLAGALLAFSACAARPAPTPTPTPDYAAELVRATERDSIEAVIGLRIVDASAADAEFGPDEPVLIASARGVERAYDLRNMSEREVANDTFEGVPIAVTW